MTGIKNVITTESFDIGDTVACDICDEEWTGRPESGGFLFSSKAVCPKCADEVRDWAILYNEEHFIRATCPKGKPFAQWILEDIRKGDNKITITRVEPIGKGDGK